MLPLQKDFPMGSQVRYKPGTGTYGEVADMAETSEGGRVIGEVIGYTFQRVRVKIVLSENHTKVVTVNPKSLELIRIH